MITDEQLRSAAQELDDALMASLPEPDDSGFSPHFQRKMNRMIQNAKRPARFLWGRCIAAILTLIIFLSGAIFLSEYTAKADFSGLFDKVVNGSYHYYLNTEYDENAPKAYRLSVIPDGYEIAVGRDRGSSGYVLYRSDASKITLIFTYVISCGDTSLGFEDAVMHRETWVNSESADLFVHTGSSTKHVVWMNEDHTVLFKVSGKFSEDELVRFAESVVPYKPN